MGVGHEGNRITIALPEEVLAPIAETPEAFAKEMRLAAAIEWYREGRVSQGDGAEIAGLNRIDFRDALLRAKVSSGQAGGEESREEVSRTDEPRAVVERSHGADGEGSLPRTAGWGAALPLTTEEAEVHYQRLGRWKGPDASPQAQGETRRFWSES